MTRKILCATTLALASLAFVPFASAQTPPQNGHATTQHRTRPATPRPAAHHAAHPSAPTTPRTGSNTTH